jgi:hypothetical protein
MRLGVLREIKNIHKFFDHMERSVKSRDPIAVQKAYMFLIHLVREMNEGCLRPESIALDLELAWAFQDLEEEEVDE